ncbi:putative urease accessory protein [Phytophthora cinnamomi]|uniref:putative urease accessory protein n=1 Tax=Phytophthora cinnamomi TaxID=4785 RepID=UPI0035596FF1|nr:putative urease accessory protein [Phytophthora cinnamomi]
MPELRRRGVEFCYHREEVADFYEFVATTFHGRVEELLWRLLPKIVDEERRAALLLRHLGKHPDTRTRCCGGMVCFKCKTATHHAGDCGDFIEDENVVECRGCGVTVVMVDGCDSLRCLCGYSFSWSLDVARQRAQRKRLAPVENAEYDIWQHWHDGFDASLQKIGDLKATQRKQRLARLVREHRQLLRRVLLPRVYRYRLRQKEPESITEAVVKLKSIAENPLAPESQMLARSQSVP